VGKGWIGIKLMKLGISESDLLSVDEWIGVEDIVATIAGDGRVKTKIYY